MTNIIVDGHKVKVAVLNCKMTREKVVVLVQDLIRDDGLSFSLAGLIKLFEGELPKRNPERILEALSSVLGFEASNFAEFEAQSA
jgi:hypothetical protein